MLPKFDSRVNINRLNIQSQEHLERKLVRENTQPIKFIDKEHWFNNNKSINFSSPPQEKRVKCINNSNTSDNKTNIFIKQHPLVNK